MITRSPGQHVFIALGTPWIDAVVAFLEPRARVDPWIMRGKMAIGDLLITVLDTTPRTVLCIETVAAPSTARRGWKSMNARTNLHGLPTVPELEQRCPSRFPRIQAGRRRTGRPDSHGRPVTLCALLRRHRHAGSDVHSCPRPNVDERAGQLHRLQLTDAVAKVQQQRSPSLSFRITIFRQAEPGDDYPAVLCRKCTGRMATSGHTNFIDYMLAKNPSCPLCGAHRTAQCAPGCRSIRSITYRGSP